MLIFLPFRFCRFLSMPSIFSGSALSRQSGRSRNIELQLFITRKFVLSLSTLWLGESSWTVDFIRRFYGPSDLRSWKAKIGIWTFMTETLSLPLPNFAPFHTVDLHGSSKLSDPGSWKAEVESWASSFHNQILPLPHYRSRFSFWQKWFFGPLISFVGWISTVRSCQDLSLIGFFISDSFPMLRLRIFDCFDI